METSKSTSGSNTSNSKNTSPKTTKEIKTDFPLSEKDEVKQAERNLKEAQKKKS